MLDVSYVRFVTKVSAWKRTIYAAFAAFNLIHNGAVEPPGFICISSSIPQLLKPIEVPVGRKAEVSTPRMAERSSRVGVIRL